MSNTTIDSISFDEYRTTWLEEITEGNPSTVELGHRFAKKLIMEWTEYTDASENDITFCDGSGDGGIDVAYLQRGENSEDSANEGDTWFIVQSKYGSAFQGKDTLLQEAQKVIDTIDGKNLHISTVAAGIVERLKEFRSKAGDKDKLVLVFATVDPLSEEERRVLDSIKAIGNHRFGSLFDVESVSVKTIFDRNEENVPRKYTLPFTANLVPSGNDLLVGSVKLVSIYEFLKSYKDITGDLDLLYEKNVRKFLGANKKVNKGIAETLRNTPERFGLFNNGITIVVEDFKQQETDKYDLTEPYIVNGCQTTRTIWETLERKLASGGTGKQPDDFLNWQEQLKRGILVVKIVKVGNSGETLLHDTTKFTNSQNAVSAKDFIALEGDFKQWAVQAAEKYNLFLEIQRGGWESQQAKEKKHPYCKRFNAWTNAFELIKVYASAWLGEPGLAFRMNEPFVPGGKIFKRITEDKDFCIDDLYAAYCLYKIAERINPLRPAKKPRRSRHLYYYTVLEFLRRIIRVVSGLEATNRTISNTVIALFNPQKPENEAARLIKETATLLDDDYFDANGDSCIFKEPAHSKDFGNDLNAHLGHFNVSAEHSPKLHELITSHWNDLRKRKRGDEKSPLDIIAIELDN